MKLTDWLAIIGAITGSASLGWQVWRDVRERGRIRLWAFPGFSISADTGFLPETEIRAVNIGRRAVRPVNIVLRRLDGRMRVLWEQKDGRDPKVLEPEADWLIATLKGDDVRLLRRLTIVDTTSRTHELSRVVIWKMRRSAVREARRAAKRERELPS